ncbi:hypothetical protein Ddye_015342 [Dipteronia dyeriana]|uniref:Uncharacterized protein n=1 Tax=Dipteronia dyeriana TaxID=168575 RepID=A0AAD9WZ24_9ROSI|nr:hypothetical protein Ddye_015342 [Dipteronia dyeriana]
MPREDRGLKEKQSVNLITVENKGPTQVDEMCVDGPGIDSKGLVSQSSESSMIPIALESHGSLEDNALGLTKIDDPTPSLVSPAN